MICAKQKQQQKVNMKNKIKLTNILTFQKIKKNK